MIEIKKTFFFLFIIIISMTSLFCQDNVPINVREKVEYYILENKLPITIGEEIIFKDYFNITDRINFQVFLMDLLEKVINQVLDFNISYEYMEELLNNLTVISNIINNYNNFCKNNNYELATIVFNNNFYFLNEYFEYNNYNIAYHYNNWISLDNNTSKMELHNLINILLQISDIYKNNYKNDILYNWGCVDNIIYEKIMFVDGRIEKIKYESEEPYFDKNLIFRCYYYIGDIIKLIMSRDYDNKNIYETLWSDIIEKNMEMEDEMLWGNANDNTMRGSFLNFLNYSIN